MKILLLSACFLFLGLNVFGQTDEVGVESVWLARDDGKGEAGEETNIFSPSDIPIYCLVQLNSQKPATVKMNLIAVSVAGVKPETKVISVSYKTNGKQNRVSFTGKPEGSWVVGKYRIDVFVNGKAGASREFEVQKSLQKIEEKNQTKPKSNLKTTVAALANKN